MYRKHQRVKGRMSLEGGNSELKSEFAPDRIDKQRSAQTRRCFQCSSVNRSSSATFSATAPSSHTNPYFFQSSRKELCACSLACLRKLPFQRHNDDWCTHVSRAESRSHSHGGCLVASTSSGCGMVSVVP